jgi:hypothetical protein
MRVSRQGVISELVEAAEMAKMMMEPASIISAMKNVALICGYYQQEQVKPARVAADDAELVRMNALSDAELLKIIAAGQAVGQ